MFINQNDFRKIAESMTEITDRIISEKQIEDLRRKQTQVSSLYAINGL